MKQFIPVKIKSKVEEQAKKDIETKNPFAVFLEVSETVCSNEINKNSNVLNPYEAHAFIDGYEIVFSNEVETMVLDLFKQTCLSCGVKNIDQGMIDFTNFYEDKYKYNLGTLGNYGAYITNFSIPMISAGLASYIPTFVNGDCTRLVNLFYMNLILLLSNILTNLHPVYHETFDNIFQRAIVREEEIEE